MPQPQTIAIAIKMAAVEPPGIRNDKVRGKQNRIDRHIYAGIKDGQIGFGEAGK